MRVFLSYASSQGPLAEQLVIGLRQEHYGVFFDRSSLYEGEGYNAPIREEIIKADLFVFLVTNDALEPGRYTLTELRFAEERWPNPDGRVLPVIAGDSIDPKQLPAYLRAVDVLVTKGDPVAETLAEVGVLADRLRRRRRRRLARSAMQIAAAIMALGVVAWVALGRSSRGAVAAALLFFASFVATASAQSLVRGLAINAASGAPIVGATVELRHRGRVLTSVSTNAEGRFEAAVDVGTTPAAELVDLAITSAGFASASRILTIASGRVSAFDPLALLPQGLAR